MVEHRTLGARVDEVTDTVVEQGERLDDHDVILADLPRTPVERELKKTDLRFKIVMAVLFGVMAVAVLLFIATGSS